MQALRLEHILALLRRWQADKGSVHIVSLHPQNLREQAFSTSLAHSLGIPLECVSSLDALGTHIAGATCVLTERYHGALTALAQGVPFLALREAPGDKLDALAEQFHCPSIEGHSLDSSLLLATDWERIARTFPAAWDEVHVLAESGEKALRETLKRYTACRWR